MNTTKLLILSSINQRLVIDTYRVGAHFIRFTSCSPLRNMLVNVMFEVFRRSQECIKCGQRYSKINNNDDSKISREGSTTVETYS